MAADAYVIAFPDGYETEEWIWTSKGYLVIKVEVGGPAGRQYSLTFIDPVRLAQDLDTELSEAESASIEPNTIVVRTVDREAVGRAVAVLARRGFDGLVPD